MIYMLISSVEPEFGEIIQACGVVELSFLIQFCVDVHDNGGLCVAIQACSV